MGVHVCTLILTRQPLRYPGRDPTAGAPRTKPDGWSPRVPQGPARHIGVYIDCLVSLECFNKVFDVVVESFQTFEHNPTHHVYM